MQFVSRGTEVEAAVSAAKVPTLLEEKMRNAGAVMFQDSSCNEHDQSCLAGHSSPARSTSEEQICSCGPAADGAYAFQVAAAGAQSQQQFLIGLLGF